MNVGVCIWERERERGIFYKESLKASNYVLMFAEISLLNTKQNL